MIILDKYFIKYTSILLLLALQVINNSNTWSQTQHPSRLSIGLGYSTGWAWQNQRDVVLIQPYQKFTRGTAQQFSAQIQYSKHRWVALGQLQYQEANYHFHHDDKMLSRPSVVFEQQLSHRSFGFAALFGTTFHPVPSWRASVLFGAAIHRTRMNEFRSNNNFYYVPSPTGVDSFWISQENDLILPIRSVTDPTLLFRLRSQYDGKWKALRNIELNAELEYGLRRLGRYRFGLVNMDPNTLGEDFRTAISYNRLIQMRFGLTYYFWNKQFK
jgi:hypothetical protein